MMHLPAVRWGKPYDSLEKVDVVHFHTGEPMAKVSQANGGITLRDLKHISKARDALRQFAPEEILNRCRAAGELYRTGTLNLPGDAGTQSPDDFVKMQSASTGLPEHMCRANMEKIHFVLSEMPAILDALTRGLDLKILQRGFGMESRGVLVSYQAQSPILGAVLPSNSPGVHTLWLPAVAMQIGLVLKPGSTEPWTPYRVIAAMIAAGLPAEAFGLYPGGHDVGAAILAQSPRAMIFGSEQTIQQYAGNPRVQVHGPGFTKIFLADDVVDDWPKYLDLMIESIASNGGRSCINCSGVWASRHTLEIAKALAEKLGPIEVLPPHHPEAKLAAFTVPAMAEGTWNMVAQDAKESGVTDMTMPYGERLVKEPLCAYLRPMVVHCNSAEPAVARREYMFPFAAVVNCPEDQFLRQCGPTLVGTLLTRRFPLIDQFASATQIDRLNVGPFPTQRLNWLQPHEGNLVEFLFRSRAVQQMDF
jgi:acyl-CoA reductase-like NAD-dependent aldehyde dehydrogenase